MRIRVGIMLLILFIGISGHLNAFGAVSKYQLVDTDEHKASLAVSKEAYEILSRIVEAEATGGTIAQKKNVASCVLARVESKSWESTIKGVVFSHSGNTYQFTPVKDGRYYTVKITESTRNAVNAVLKNGKTHSCMYFCSYTSYEKGNSWHRTHLTYVFKDAEHIYCN